MAVQRSILLLMGRYSRTTSTEALQVLTGCLPLDMEVVRAAVRYGLRRGIEVRVPMLRALRLSVADITEDYRLWFRERMYGEVEEELNREWRNRCIITAGTVSSINSGGAANIKNSSLHKYKERSLCNLTAWIYFKSAYITAYNG
uniref:Uncharacterized protein n=1 Tax=Rhodnius prolixus TaxID=13249 RepID=T1HNZ1_RHOPR